MRSMVEFDKRQTYEVVIHMTDNLLTIGELRPGQYFTTRSEKTVYGKCHQEIDNENYSVCVNMSNLVVTKLSNDTKVIVVEPVLLEFKRV